MQEAASSDIAIHNVTLQHQHSRSTAVPVNFTFTYPVEEPATRMPMVMLLNGASVESYWYRRLIAQLSSKGFVVASSDYYRSFKTSSSQLPSVSRSLLSYLFDNFAPGLQTLILIFTAKLPILLRLPSRPGTVHHRPEACAACMGNSDCKIEFT